MAAANAPSKKAHRLPRRIYGMDHLRGAASRWADTAHARR